MQVRPIQTATQADVRVASMINNHSQLRRWSKSLIPPIADFIEGRRFVKLYWLFAVENGLNGSLTGDRAEGGSWRADRVIFGHQSS